MASWSRAALAAALLVASATLATLSIGQETPPAGGGGSPGSAGGGGTPTGGATTARSEPLPGGAPELAGYKDKIVFVVDRSGSMALAGRFDTALDIVEQLLLEMPKDTKFDIYLATEAPVSVFNGEWFRPTGDMRKQIRAKVAQAGGLDYGGFTDLVTVLKVATERRRPDAVYLLSDGVATINELETDKIIAAVVRLALEFKIPVHTVLIGVGQDVAEDATEATNVMKGLAKETGGIFREVKSELKPTKRAFLLHPPWAPLAPEDQARIHLKSPSGKEMRVRQFGGKTGLSDVIIEVDDPALRLGNVAFEYSEMKVFVRTFMQNGKLFFESRPIGLRRGGDRLISAVAIRIVSATDDSPPDEIASGGFMPIKCPQSGSVEFVYKRGSREFREAAVWASSQQ